MDSNSKSTVVLVTGCSQGGIGHGLCCEFAQHGCTVYATARRVETMEDLKGMESGALRFYTIRTSLGIHTLQLDVTDSASIKAAVETILALEGHIDILVNNAGTFCVMPMLEQDLNIARQAYETNVWGPLAVIQTTVPSMMKRGSGTIVNIGSIAGLNASPWAGIYSSSKSALHAWTHSMRVELRPYGITTVLVYPG
ncbi:hypothetical protein THASP1DRAFT_15219 [Thamnocephalis sphaerospora]|uniref:NAD(P)-binding protein n=1 Tax=Thamnocephalis sphaerospora TaxID=78915 RepID=A0A4P9XI53_9FUNG|nr:hypothetical protein THASP1DRAFT_20478 [Thamnocephalis sphaerospora]RKP08764.1 hypothetical protein THASP1DRAFT_15219 [Thamnocephalis sphaerospora]|eukprot:RKP04940.1 hypothetical protein THASP1DRAFT_20478 [Thamnocephalis sphaerospora]